MAGTLEIPRKMRNRTFSVLLCPPYSTKASFSVMLKAKTGGAWHGDEKGIGRTAGSVDAGYGG